MKLEILIITLVCLIGCANSQIKTERTNDRTSEKSNESTSYGSGAFPHYPLTSTYYQDFMDSTIQFSKFKMLYNMDIDSEHQDAKIQRLVIAVRQDLVDDTISDFELLNVESFYSYYTEDMYSTYEYDLPRSLVIPMLQLIQQNWDYYFDAEEYGGEESLEIYSGRQFGHRNFIEVDIYPPNRDIYTPFTAKAFCKGWDPGDDPPVELQPLVDYLENVILPEMRQHPTD
ncbi:MAG: hypothetical protein RTU30_16630 [Candidatus Thorarchaeota archaeon]